MLFWNIVYFDPDNGKKQLMKNYKVITPTDTEVVSFLQ